MEQWERAWVGAILSTQAKVVKKKNGDRAANSQQICLQIRTKHRQVAQRLAAMTGTDPEEQEQRKFSPAVLRRQCIEHCPDAHVHVDTLESLPPITIWTVTGVSAAIVLWNVREYMITTHEPWAWYMQQIFAQLRLRGPGSGAIRKAVIRLHGLGWDLPPMLAELLPRAVGT